MEVEATWSRGSQLLESRCTQMDCASVHASPEPPRCEILCRGRARPAKQDERVAVAENPVDVNLLAELTHVLSNQAHSDSGATDKR